MINSVGKCTKNAKNEVIAIWAISRSFCNVQMSHFGKNDKRLFLAPRGKNWRKKVRPLSFLQLSNLKKIKWSYFHQFLPLVSETAICCFQRPQFCRNKFVKIIPGANIIKGIVQTTIYLTR